MDFLSRDEQRHAVEADRRAERGSAGAAGAAGGRERARGGRAAARSADRAAHVGYHLVGPRPRAISRPTSAIGRRSARACGGSLLGASDAAVSGIDRGRHGGAARRGRRAGCAGVDGPAASLAVALALLVVPALDLAIAFVQRLVAWRSAPRRLPRLDLSDGVPDDARTMVVVPTLLASAEGVATLLEHLEVLAHGNLDPHIHFAILSDFVDAPSAEREDDDGRFCRRRAKAFSTSICDSARATPIASSCSIASAAGIRASASGWAGSASAARSTSSTGCCAAPTTRRSRRRSATWTCCRSVRYCITLDTDTLLPRDAAKSLIGIIAHPLQPAARSTPQPGRVTEGYAILQPRVSVTMASAAGSLFARLYAGHTGVDPYTTAVSDTYQDLFDEGIFTGKGLYDVDAFVARAARPRAGQHAAVARPLRGAVRAHRARDRRRSRGRLPVERARARQAAAPLGARRLADSVLAAAGRADAIGLAAQPPAAHRALEDLRQPAPQPDGAGDASRCSLAGWTLLPGSPLVWTAIGAGAAGVSGRRPAGRALLAASGAPARWRAAVEDVRLAAARAALQVVFLASEAYEHAARDHRDARARRLHARAAARVGDGGRDRASRRHAAARRLRAGA